MKTDAAAREFLSKKRIAVAGAKSKELPSIGSGIADRLRDNGHEVFLVHPTAGRIGEHRCYPSLEAIEGGVEAVVVTTSADKARAVAEQAVAAGVEWIWFHQGTGPVSFDDEALRVAREGRLKVIAVGCPMMYCAPDFFHKCLRGVFRLVGRIPRQVEP